MGSQCRPNSNQRPSAKMFTSFAIGQSLWIMTYSLWLFLCKRLLSGGFGKDLVKNIGNSTPDSNSYFHPICLNYLLLHFGMNECSPTKFLSCVKSGLSFESFIFTCVMFAMSTVYWHWCISDVGFWACMC